MFLDTRADDLHSRSTQYTWENPIPELVDMILSHIRWDCEHFDFRTDTKMFKSEVAQLSLTCKLWSSVFRPYLFQRITLRSREDLPFLLAMVKSPLSRWLASSFISIIVDAGGPEAQRRRAMSCCGIKALLRRRRWENVSR